MAQQRSDESGAPHTVARGRRQRKPRLLSLCSGIGGIDLAAEMAGWEIAGQCELDDYCQRVLAKHWPDVKRVADIRSVWGNSFDGAIDCIAAGFPCQPASVAGKRRGADDSRWLWPEVLRVVQVYEPAWCVFENVPGLISLGLDTVLADLASSGYEAWPLVFSAAAVGAAHERKRVFIVAHANSKWQPQPQGRIGTVRRRAIYSGEDVADTDSDRCGNGARQSVTLNGCCGTSDVGAPNTADVGDPSGAGCQEPDVSRVACDAGHPARRPAALRGDTSEGQPHGPVESRMGGNLDGFSGGMDRDRGDACNDESYPFTPTPAGRGEAQFAWEPPRVTTERIPNHAARLKALGNAVYPAQCYPILAAIIQQWRIEQDY